MTKKEWNAFDFRVLKSEKAINIVANQDLGLYDYLKDFDINDIDGLTKFLEDFFDEFFVFDENETAVDYENAVHYMDDEIREELHREIAPCTNQVFIDEYCKRHMEKYGEKFEV